MNTSLFDMPLCCSDSKEPNCETKEEREPNKALRAAGGWAGGCGLGSTSTGGLLRAPQLGRIDPM